MAESNLTLTYSNIAAEVGYLLGYQSKAYASYSATEQADIDAIIQAGYRQFLYPSYQAESGQITAYEWTFLRPLTTMASVVGQIAYDLPDDFGSLDGIMTYVSADLRICPIRQIGEADFRLLQQQNPSVTNFWPYYFCIIPKAFTPTTGQRWTLQLWPPPDAIYTLKYRYVVLPNKPTTTNLYVYGGLRHSETFKESCLSKAEQRMNDEAGLHTMLFKELLMTSIATDKKTNQGQFFGYNTDNSDERNRIAGYYGFRAYPWSNNIVTYDGISP